MVFYSAKAASGVGDQLYAYDYKKDEQTQLTDNIFAINHIIPLDNGILLGQVPFGTPHIAKMCIRDRLWAQYATLVMALGVNYIVSGQAKCSLPA